MDALMHTARQIARQPAHHAVRVLDPPFCYGAWSGPRVDLPVLRLSVRDVLAAGARGVVLSDIPDDDASLAEALDVPGVLGALAIGCGHLDLWVRDPVADALKDACTVRRGTDTTLACGTLDAPTRIRVVWHILETLAANPPQVIPPRLR